MLRVLNRDYKQSVESVLTEFPGCHFLIKLEDILLDEGYLIAISENSASFGDLCDLRDSFSDTSLFALGGAYKDAAAIGIQYEAR